MLVEPDRKSKETSIVLRCFGLLAGFLNAGVLFEIALYTRRSFKNLRLHRRLTITKLEDEFGK